jgi:hypothetical protein
MSETVDDLVIAAAAKNNQQEPIVTPHIQQNEPPARIADDANKGGEDVAALKAELESLKKQLEQKSSTTELTPEEKAKQQELYDAELISYAVKEGKMKLEDFDKYKTVQKAADRDLVFEDWKTEFKEDNPDIDAEDFEEEAKRAFEQEMKLDSKNEKVKARAEAKLAKRAAELRSPHTSAYEKTRKDYDEERDLRQTFPNFTKKIEDFSKEFIPEKYEFFKTKDGDEDVSVALDITEADKKEIFNTVSKEMQTPEIYTLYKQNKLEEIREIAKKKADDLVFAKSKEQGLKKIAEVFETRGKAKGAIGAKNSFALNQNRNNQSDKQVGMSAREEVLRSHGIIKE